MLGKTALILEDESITSLDLKFILKSSGFCNSVIFSKGKQAIDYLERENPLLALLDINSADDISGFEVARKLFQKEIPFIFLSAFENPKNLKLAQSLNPLAIIKKPICCNTLKNVLCNFYNSVVLNSSSSTKAGKP